MWLRRCLASWFVRVPSGADGGKLVDVGGRPNGMETGGPETGRPGQSFQPSCHIVKARQPRSFRYDQLLVTIESEHLLLSFRSPLLTPSGLQERVQAQTQ